jgi:methylthioribose-1-phosphate isomerase
LRARRPTPPGAAAANPAFDVTPAEWIDGFIAKRGLCAAREQDLAALFA